MTPQWTMKVSFYWFNIVSDSEHHCCWRLEPIILYLPSSCYTTGCSWISFRDFKVWFLGENSYKRWTFDTFLRQYSQSKINTTIWITIFFSDCSNRRKTILSLCTFIFNTTPLPRSMIILCAHYHKEVKFATRHRIFTRNFNRSTCCYLHKNWYKATFFISKLLFGSNSFSTAIFAIYCTTVHVNQTVIEPK